MWKTGPLGPVHGGKVVGSEKKDKGKLRESAADAEESGANPGDAADGAAESGDGGMADGVAAAGRGG